MIILRSNHQIKDLILNYSPIRHRNGQEEASKMWNLDLGQFVANDFNIYLTADNTQQTKDLILAK